MKDTQLTVVVKDEPVDNVDTLEEYDLSARSDQYLNPHTVKMENGNNAELRVSLVRLEDSKDPEIVMYMNTGMRSLWPIISCYEPQTMFAIPGIKHESVDLGISKSETVGYGCESHNQLLPSDSIVTAVKDEFELDDPLLSEGLKNKLYECNICLEKFSDNCVLQKHILLHTREKSHQWNILNKTFTSKSCSNSHLSHITSHTGDQKRPYACNICQKFFSVNASLKRHMLTHTGEKPHACDICQRKFARKQNRDEHILIHTGEKRFTCDTCQKKFFARNTLTKHMLVHNVIKPYACDVCHKTYSRKDHLKYHAAIHMEPITCDVCLKKFSQKRSLIRHMSLHNAEKSYICNICQKKYSQKPSLNMHMLTHTAERPYACDICEKKFLVKYSLYIHMLYHTGEKPHACTICGKKYRLKQSLNIHMFTHTGERQYACHICQKKFAMKHTLNGHLLIHSGVKPHICNICQKKFLRKSDLNTHMLTHRINENVYVMFVKRRRK